MDQSEYAKQFRAQDLARRSSLNLKNAQTYQSFFDQAMKDGYAIVPWEFPDFLYKTSATCYRKVSDARKFLAMHAESLSDEERTRYQMFKAMSKIIQTDKGIEIIMDRRRARVGVPTMTAAPPKREWRDAFDEWVETAADGQIFNLTGLFLTPDDQEYVRVTCNQLGAICKVSENEIRTMK